MMVVQWGKKRKWTKKERSVCFVLFGADYGVRTRYPHLGKVALYQMS